VNASASSPRGPRTLVDALLAPRLAPEARHWLDEACAELARGADAQRFSGLIALSSRRVPKGPLEPSDGERESLRAALDGMEPERWTLLETARIALVLARGDLGVESGAQALEEAFRYADVGEACALYRSLALLPDPKRFAWRAGEGARSNMRAIFESACCDTPFPMRWFDDVAWRQAVIKALFVEAPLWRVQGLDTRLSPELARMALDLAEERRSAGRAVNPELWLCLGTHGGARGVESLERELAKGHREGRAAAAIALVRAGERDRVTSLSALERDALVKDAMVMALGGRSEQAAFRSLAGAVPKTH
jgi:hypothetical protein